MFEMFWVQPRIAQINEIKIDTVEPGASQVRAAEIGDSDLIGRFESLVEKVIGIKSGASPFRCDHAPHKSAASRS